ncbi:hypothetical protein Htur_1551 [Haloterrigena turkmenica DSM 5511]|uniref:Uncharacterized protein n=1 Tax=Haloterrigena turkmenica (strain ATCC 51198 / DSM 5511 / JCM 9101 / NCIMB 13204 / VKM B-1734 / 4k) TaxID=543526 RepID=D2RQV6_HALTV|nr:hypothetical protein [Haloterrigena turkmenica]ADB60437.1 hypothetical protein Htur_1551 [Haloterrigena turkmenica DSM 5511]
MTDESPPVPEAVLTSATERLEAEELSIADNEEILRALSELTPIYETDRSYFVLGNYDPEPMGRLDLVVDRLNRRRDAYAFRMNDVNGGWDNGIQKFCLIADLVSHVVGVAEREPSGFLVEQGLLAGTEEYFEKTHVLKREYPEERHPYGWMEDGVFDLLESEGRLYEWRTEDELREVLTEIP